MSVVVNRKRKRMNNRLGKCAVCRITDGLYTCPRCETVTCSLNCVKRHKKELDCDGVRVRTKYVPADKMSENNLLSDYRLLEDVRRCVEMPFKNNTINEPSIRTVEALKKTALSRGILVSTLPEKFEKHWENTSVFRPKEDCIYWHLKVSFINANFYTLSLNECAETMTLADVVKGCLSRGEEYWKKQAVEDPLKVYRMIDFSKISVLMAADKMSGNQKKFYILDMSKSLRENFVGKCIVEFPQLCVAIEDCYVTSTVQENLVHDFFGGKDFKTDSEEEQPANEFERIMKKKAAKSKKREAERKKNRKPRNDDSDRESGELTDSSDNDSFFSDSDSNSGSSDELFKESEFRSIYKDLLNTFDIDATQVQRKKTKK